MCHILGENPGRNPHLRKHLWRTLGGGLYRVQIHISWVELFVSLQRYFSGWLEAYPTQMETASVVTEKLLQELISRFGLSFSLESNNGLAFMISFQASDKGPKCCLENTLYL